MRDQNGTRTTAYATGTTDGLQYILSDILIINLQHLNVPTTLILPTSDLQLRCLNCLVQPKDVTVTLMRGLLYIDVDMGQPLTMETATRNKIPIASPSAGDPSPVHIEGRSENSVGGMMR
jgi:hypothetical protein